ncbi:MAG: 4Fe-4S dicluster domain-containing protein [Spirochaetales bacterium]|nr:4Fe-4S dicluster domain-containing protein [Spirochaetales bacterium]
MGGTESIENKLKDAVKDLFLKKKVDIVIGFEKGSLPLTSRPCFIRSSDMAERLVWNASCTNNLAVYLPRFFQKVPRAKKSGTPPPVVGIVAKGCDARSVVGLIKEKQILKENVVIIGMSCQGVIDRRKIESFIDGSFIAGGRQEPGGILEITTGVGDKKKIKVSDVLAESCIECQYPHVENADVRIDGESITASDDGYKAIKAFEEKSPEERWQYFTDEISRCIRCYACRQACPNCYCKVCFAEQTLPRWIGPGDELSDVMIYHIGRIFHQAGRCVECNACVRACPVGIDLRLFTRKLCMDVKELFGYIPGLSIEELPPLLRFELNDNNDFITTG